MEQSVITGLINAGGMGLLAAALFYLHTRSIDRFDTMQQRALETFREELRAEREQSERHHLNIMQAISELK